MNIMQIFRQFPDQDSCIKHLEAVRWASGVTCAYCDSENTYEMPKESRHYCNSCKKSFSVTINTIFHDTRIPLQKGFLAIALIINAKKGISACQLGRGLEVNKDTAWRMAMKNREGMQDSGEMLTGIVEMDETYVGGKPRKSGKKDDDNFPPNPRGRGTKKTPVVGMVSRGGDVKAKDLNLLIRENIDPQGSVLITDEYKGYNKVSQFLKHYTPSIIALSTLTAKFTQTQLNHSGLS